MKRTLVVPLALMGLFAGPQHALSAQKAVTESIQSLRQLAQDPFVNVGGVLGDAWQGPGLSGPLPVEQRHLPLCSINPDFTLCV